MRRTIRRLGPLQQSRLAGLLLIAAAALAAFGAFLRHTDGSLHRPGLGYLCSTAALFVAVGAAIWKARVAAMLVVFRAGQVRLNATLSLIAGVLVALTGCVLASGVSESRPGWQSLGEGVLMLGIGLGLTGLLSIFWAFGVDYLGDRIDKLSEEDW